MDLANQLCLDRHLRNHTVFPAVFLPALVVHIYLFFPSLEALLLKRLSLDPAGTAWVPCLAGVRDANDAIG